MSGRVRRTESSIIQENANFANMAKSQFLSNMSHEIRTPIIGILGSLDLLEQSDLSQQQAANISIIRECGEQLLQIIDNILDVSKIEVGLVTPNLEPCNLHELTLATIERVDTLLKRKGLGFKLNIDSQIPAKLMLDKSKLQQIMLNLLNNSMKFTLEGSIELRAGIHPEDSSRLLFSITDTGIGIPQSFLERLYDPFTQADSSNSRQYGGTGLGLFICKKLLGLMGGEINVSSMPGSGTTFFFSIPLMEADEVELQSQDEFRPEERESREDSLLDFTPIQVLLVEDNPLNQKIVGQMLHNYGFEVIMASNGLEGLRILQDSQVKIILMDMQMPIMDGYEATQFIRQDSKWREIPIIAMTAHSLPGDREKCLACGCTSYISKPFKGNDLVQLMKGYIKRDFKESTSPQHLIAELMPEFITLLDEMIGDLDIAVKNRNIDNIQAISHDIKGTAGMYGFMKVSQLATAIEQASRIKDMQRIKQICSELYQQVEKIKIQVS
ncbi:MAG: ATP-binding protein [Syntrophomonas sp.]|uniref:ATP-binding protein n=1 Tax=Syntrophomonas sp. TaxID=2053627 RepID=UPI0026345BD6|nr:ATP-binding protein [Syntrophomonas sp.]MDD2510105.1 ATP-binding protein [Syntrophomonas sp.]MDD3879373.1 ATP-binding protein [Syntrophomonas sp.]MDD4626873.1 ATP-binding protein [Syntrophomonas sp.]